LLRGGSFKWYIDALDSFFIRMNDNPNSEANIRLKDELLRDSNERIKYWKHFFQIGTFQHPLNGVCGVVVAKIFQKLKKNKTLDLVSIIAKYKNGVGKKIAGLESFKGVLWDSWSTLEKDSLSYKALPSIEAVSFHTFNRLNITEELVDEVKKQFTNDFNEAIHKINKLKEGCYHLQLASEKGDNGQLNHSIFLRKKADKFEIVDPNIGLLESNNHKETNELFEKLLGFYVKKNKIYNLFMYRMN
jgi:hypothetical protein